LKKPLVSICIPVYNHDNFIKDSVLSVINQTYKNIELIIINDGSTDGSHKEILKLIDKCQQRFVRFEYIHRDNKGVAYTLNEALEWAKGKYFTSISSDDIMLENKVKLLVEVLETHPDYPIAFGDANFIDEKGNFIDPLTLERVNQNESYNSFVKFYTRGRTDIDFFGSYKSLLRGNYIPGISYLTKTEILKSIKWKNEFMLEDWDIWLRFSKKYKFFYVDIPVALYRWHENNTVKKFNYKLSMDALKILEREKKYISKNRLDYAHIIKEYKEIIIRELLNSLNMKQELKNIFSYISESVNFKHKLKENRHRKNKNNIILVYGKKNNKLICKLKNFKIYYIKNKEDIYKFNKTSLVVSLETTDKSIAVIKEAYKNKIPVISVITNYKYIPNKSYLCFTSLLYSTYLVINKPYIKSFYIKKLSQFTDIIDKPKNFLLYKNNFLAIIEKTLTKQQILLEHFEKIKNSKVFLSDDELFLWNYVNIDAKSLYNLKFLDPIFYFRKKSHLQKSFGNSKLIDIFMKKKLI
jgi:alpha-1,3-rhamnosyltransferase